MMGAWLERIIFLVICVMLLAVSVFMISECVRVIQVLESPYGR